MPGKKHHPILTLFLILSLLVNLLNIQTVRADDETPTEPAPTQVVTEPPVEETPPVVESTPVPTETTPEPVEPTLVSTDEASLTATPIAEILTQVPEGTAVVVLDESGSAIPLVTQEAAEIVEVNDPMWCPAGVLPGGAGCSASYATVSALVANMVSNTSAYTQNGVIYFTAAADATFSLTNTTLTGGDFATLSIYDLTLQGGWNGSTAAPSFSGQTSFAGFSLNIGTAGNPWIGNVTLNDFTFNGSASTTPVTVYTSSGDINLSNIDVNNQQNNVNTAVLNSTSGDITVQNGSTFDGNTGNQSQGFSATTTSGSITISDTAFTDSTRTGNPSYDGATLSAPTVTLTNVTATGSDGDGITINNVNVVTLNNVTASNNGNAGGAAGLPGNDGSGVLVNGLAGSSVIINGGTFNSNQEYGVQVGNPANTTIYIQSAPTCTNNVSNLDPSANSCYNDTVITDSTAPVITPTVSGTAGANGWYTSNVSVSWSFTDAESGILSSSGCTTSNLNTETSGTVVTCSATNNAGLSNSGSVTIKIDKTAPSAALTVIAGTLGSNGWYTSDVTLQTSGTDSLSTPVSCTANQFQTTETTGTNFNGSCTNDAGLTTNATPVTIKLDKTGPTANLSVTAGTAGTNGWYTSDVTVHTSGTDATSAVTCTADQFQTTETAGTVFNGNCTDDAGFSTSAAPLTIMLDKTNPTIAFVSRTVANGNGWNNTDVTVNWSCTDALSGAVSPNVSQTVTTEGASQSTNGTCTDNAGNTSSDTQTGINIDKTVPTLTLPANITTEAASPSGAVVNYTATVTDNLDASVAVNCSPASGSTFSLGATTVNCSSTDQADNTATGSFQITVVDSTAPVIAGHADETVEATSAAGATVIYTSPATTDAFDGPGIASCAPASASNFALGNTTVTCNATDSNGNAAISTTFTVYVVDTTGPTLNLPANITANATGASGAVVTYSASATDIVDGSVIAICSPASSSTFPLGPTTVNCSATDSHTNSSSGSFVINVQDVDGPTITLPANITTEATGASGAVVTYSASATDTVDGPRPVTCVPASGSTFALGTATVNCSASDLSGHTTNAAFLITVQDTTAPVIAAHANETAEATSAAGANVTYATPTTTDAFDGSGTASCSPASGSNFVLGDTVVTCNATDSNGNAATSTTFTIHVVDTTAPTISSHPDVTVTTSNSLGTNVTYTNPSTSDIVDGNGSASCSPISGSFFPVGDTQVVCTATDMHSNSASPVTFFVHVINSAPSTPPTSPITPAPKPPSSTSSLTIPVTGNGLINLTCLTTINAFDVKVIFHNLCDYQAKITNVDASSLPDKLPAGYSFIKGLDVLVLNQGKIIKTLPDGAGTQMVFPLPSGDQDQFAMLYWNDEDGDGNGEWVEISQTINSDKLSQTMSVNPKDELYQITLDALEIDIYKILTTKETGIFVLVKK